MKKLLNCLKLMLVMMKAGFFTFGGSLARLSAKKIRKKNFHL